MACITACQQPKWSSSHGRRHQKMMLCQCHANLDALADQFGAVMYAQPWQRPSDGIRGLVCSEAVQQAPLISVPTTSCLVVPLNAPGEWYKSHWTNMPASLLAAGITAVAPEHAGLRLDIVLLAAWMLALSRGTGLSTPQQAWQSYLVHVMPRLSALDCLLVLSSQQASSLPSTELQEEAVRQRSWAELMHNISLSASSNTSLPDSSLAVYQQLGISTSLAESLWALALARSRSFAFHMRNRRSSTPAATVLVPLVDLVNHAPRQAVSSQLEPARPPWARPGCTSRHLIAARAGPHKHEHNSTAANCELVLTPDNQWFHLKPLRPLKAGEELLLDYGYRSAIDSLCDYGFVM